MPFSLFGRVMRLLAESTQHDLRRQVQFLKAENEILRARIVGPVRTTARERARLLRLGKPLGAAIRSLITVVSPETFRTWVRAEKKTPARGYRRRQLRGRPRTPSEIRELVLRLARETDWGHTSIHSELIKLGIKTSRRNVGNILTAAGVPTGPERGEGTWDAFLKAHAQTLWACDFVSKRVLTWRGWVEAYLLVFIHIQTRRVHISPAVIYPGSAWAVGEGLGFVAQAARMGLPVRMLIRDRDNKYGPGFNRAMKDLGVRQARLPIRSPNLNAHVERFIKTLEHECLDRFIVMGTRHLDHLAQQFSSHYNSERPHSKLGGMTPVEYDRQLRGGGAGEARKSPRRSGGEVAGPLSPPASSAPALAPGVVGRIRCQERLGGVLKHYYRRAA